ncbi:MAG: hypothetical protein KatS3mg042_1672 [Rhodothermaceae bacterium]|nr:MAG: hypothetical protein KatS3mg042_1672 [Rhodothermaceae bacterium]
MLRRFHLLALVLLTAVPALAQSTPEEGSGTVIAYTWADMPTADSYTPSTAYTFNPDGDVTITRTSAGRYVVQFAGLGDRFRERIGASSDLYEGGAGGHVQVTAYGNPAIRCHPASWGLSGSSLNVAVHCNDHTGTAKDSRFSLLVLEPGLNPGALAYVWANAATASDAYTPARAYAYNAGSSSITITRTARGTYTVTFRELYALGDDTLPLGGFHAQVSAYGSDAKAICQSTGGYRSTDGVAADDGRDLTFWVLCYDTSGATVDARFTLLALAPGALIGTHGYAYADQSTETSPYTVAQGNSPGGQPVVTRQATGRYAVVFPGLSLGVGGNVQVSGQEDKACQVSAWGSVNGTDLSVFVACTDKDGADADARFFVMAVFGQEPSPGDTRATLTFDDLADGETLTDQYLAATGISFPRGVLVLECDYDDAACLRSRSPHNVVTPPYVTDFTRDSLVITFARPQTEVALSVTGTVPGIGTTTDVLLRGLGTSTAGDTVIVDEAMGTVRHNGAWMTRLQLTAGDTPIHTVTLKSTSNPYNLFLVDDLYIDSPVATTRHTQPGTDLPASFDVGSYPNPFNTSTALRFTLPADAHVMIAVYDVLGRQVAQLLDERRVAGTHQIRWQAGNLPSGLYLYRVQAGDKVRTGRVVLAR